MKVANQKPLLWALLKEPLSLFLLIAAALFTLSAALGPSGAKTIIIDDADIEARLFLEELNTGEEVSAERREEIVQATIEEQVLVAEAIAMGLDKDSRIYTVLAQKMLHVMSADVIQPNDTELKTFFANHSQQYVQPERYNIDEFVLNRDEERAFDAVLAEEPERLRALPPLTERDLAAIFSAEFAAQVVVEATESITSGNERWTGPFISNRGRHWLRVTEITASGVPELESIRGQVRMDWIGAEEEKRQREQVAALLATYKIIRSSGAEQ